MLRPCWTCRSRTVRCDQSRVPCLKCEKAGLECHDKKPLRWVTGVAIRGKLRGFVFKDASEASQDSRAPRSNVKQVSLTSAKRLQILQTPAFGMQDPHMSNLDQLSRFYVDYCRLAFWQNGRENVGLLISSIDCKQICKLYILFDSDSNPFRNLLAFGLEDLALQKAIVALAARHFANTGHSFDETDAVMAPRFMHARMDALLFKKQTIQALSSSLSHPGPRKTESTMATILLLIFLDLLESGIDGWNSHLQGARGLLVLNQSLAEPVQDSYAKADPGDTIRNTRKFITEQLSLYVIIPLNITSKRLF